MDDSKLYNYWGKASFTDESFHLLVYHCLDVAAMGQVLLRQSLQKYPRDDVLTQNVTQNKEASISLISFFLALHDIGKFSKGFQNYKPEIVNIFQGELYEELNHKKSKKHDLIGFYLWQKMWSNIWQENWLNLDKSFDEKDWKKLLDLWFKSIMNHHNRDQINDFSITQDNIASDLTEEDISTAYFYVKKVADLLLDNKSKMKLLNMQNIGDYSLYISDFLQDIAVKSDRIILFDKSKYFPYNSRYMLIQQYWQ
ncbi:MAG: CRISPR-associated endonuclease Cas3'', partial [Methanosarcinaceae archaeon]|nr:CRISPR-associated endonuclease Cas3'' [Methanosarcinaceae archaeon]